MPRCNRYPVSFAFRLTEADGTRLRGVADAHGYTPAEWARRIVSEAVQLDFERRAVRGRVLHAELLRELLLELRRQGNNLNQIAHALNIDPNVSRGHTAALAQLGADGAVLTGAILDALGAGNDL